MSIKEMIHNNPYLKSQGSLPSKIDLLYTAIGCFFAIGTISFLSQNYHLHLLIASFGASALLLFGAPSSPMAQPRNVVGGHTLSAIIGVIIYQLGGNNWLTITLAVTFAIVAMLATSTGHPPGGATAIVAVTSQADFHFIFSPILAGTILLVTMAVLMNYVTPGRQYPLPTEPSNAPQNHDLALANTKTNNAQ